MSLVHMLFSKSVETDAMVEYEVMSTDFNDGREWKPIARIAIDKLNSDYDFEPLNEWRELAVIHPKRYMDVTDDEASALHSGAYGYCGAWTGRIHAWTMRLIESKTYPPKYPS